MSNTASPRRTSVDWLRRLIATGQPSTALAALILTVLLVSFHPFEPSGPDIEGDGGDIVNQLGFGMLGAIAIGALLTLTDRRVLTALLGPVWLLLLAFLLLSVFNTPEPSNTLRSAAFSLIGMVSVMAVLTLPRDADAFARVLAFAGLTVLALSYFGVFFMPDVAIHQASDVESQHAGLWRGLFTHKNIAGPVMTALTFAGLYLWRRGWRATGLMMGLLAAFFVLQAGSKTTLGTVPVAMTIVILPGMVGFRGLVPPLVIGVLVLAALATLGIVFLAPLRDLAAALVPDLTYTGRTTLWAFAGDMVLQKPWFGYGYENFWFTDTVTLSDHPFDREWDIRRTVHAHDSYLDLALAMGLPALGIALVAFVIAPMRDYLRIPLLRENALLADFFMMIVAFGLLNALLESFFFRRADPVWLLFVMALFGLRLVARFPVPSQTPR